MTGGEPSENLFTLGPSRIGSLIETTSVPEIRAQAAAVALRLQGFTDSPFYEVSQPKLLPALDSAGGKSPSRAS